MSVVELRQQVGWYITFSKQDVLRDLGNAVPGAQGWDMGTQLADSTASPTVANSETPPANGGTVPLAEHIVKAKQDQLAAYAASPSKQESKLSPLPGQQMSQ